MNEISNFKKLNMILSDSKHSEWCYVNTDNEFTFLHRKYVIGSDVKEYKVYNRPEDVYDFTNESLMDKVLAVEYNNGDIQIYNQIFELIIDVD